MPFIDSAKSRTVDGLKSVHATAKALPQKGHEHLSQEDHPSGLVDVIGSVYRRVPEIARDVKDFFQRTPAEIFVGIAVGAIIALPISYRHENQRALSYDVGYANTKQIVKEAGGEDLGVLTRLLMYANDAYNMPFEAANNANGDSHRFASELEFASDPQFKTRHPYTLFALCDSMKALTPLALQKLAAIRETRKEIGHVDDLLDRAWNYVGIDLILPVTHIDSKGNATIVLVYKGTTHIYTYDKDAGIASADALGKFTAVHQQFSLPEKLRTAQETDPENDYEAERSRKDKKILWNEDTYRQIASLWATGSALTVEASESSEALHELQVASPLWIPDAPRAQSKTYFTGSRFDLGPSTYRHAEEALHDGKNLEESIDRMVKSIQGIPETADRIRNIAGMIMNRELEKGKHDQGLMRQFLIQNARYYNSVFPGGMENMKFRAYMIAVWTLVAMTLGGIAGGVVDYMGNRRQNY